MKSVKIVSLLVVLAGWLAPASAEESFPSRPVTLVVPIAPGGGLDAVARFVARKFSAALGQPIVIETAPAARRTSASARSRRRPATATPCSIRRTPSPSIPALFTNLGYDVNSDLTPIGKVASLPLFIVGRASAPYKTLPELIAFAKANPEKLSYGSPGTGTPHHLGMELLKSAAGVEITHVPYKGSAPGLTDLLGGNVPLLVTTDAPVRAQLASGELIAYATLDATRVAEYPRVQAVSETLKDFEVGVWHGVFAPAGTPRRSPPSSRACSKAWSRIQELAAQLEKIVIHPSRTTQARQASRTTSMLANAVQLGGQ